MANIDKAILDLHNSIAQALSGESGYFQQLIAEKVVKWGALLLQKNADYGDSVFNPPVLAPDCDVDSAIRVRMSDKIARIRNLLKSPSEHKSETIEDTIGDLGSYCLLLLVHMEHSKNPEWRINKEPSDRTRMQ